MKIAYVYDAVYPWVKGGAEKRIYELSRRLASRGHEVHCYGIKWWQGDKDCILEGVHIHGICAPRELYSGDRRSIREAMIFAGRCLASLRGDYDVVDCQAFPYFPCFPAKLFSMRGPELFITWHEVWGDYWYEYLGRKGAFGRWVEWAASRLTDKNVAVSKRTRKDLEGLGIGGVQVVPNGIDFERIEQVKASSRQSDVVCVGRLVGHKNVDLLIRALGMAAKEVPDIQAVIIGDGPERDRLTALVRELDLEKNIEFTGFLDDYDEALALMKSSKVFASTSTREGFGMAALEANACGLPVVTVRHRMNAVCDLVTEETGLVCEPSEEGLAAAILKEIGAEKDKGQRCADLARSYDWEEIARLAEDIYERGLRALRTSR
jgi:glycosyltransferase involved in cell wall biosynthesis